MNLKNVTPHGRGVRGLNLPRSSVQFGLKEFVNFALGR
jgi:hypothetical protein